MAPTIPAVQPHPEPSPANGISTQQPPWPTTVPTAPSPLLKLPATVRNRIYSLLVVKRFPGNPITFNREPAPYFPESDNEHLQPALSKVSRQLRAEVLPIYYAENQFGLHIRRKHDFVMNDRPAFRRWLQVVGEGNNVRYISRFRFDVVVCGATVQLCLMGVAPFYELRKVTASTEQREKAVRAKVDVLLRPLSAQWVGRPFCVGDIGRVEAVLSKWSQANDYGRSKGHGWV